MGTGLNFDNAGIRREAIGAWIRLSEKQDEHASYPCKDNPYFYTDFSDQNEQRVVTGEDAEQLCYGCPLIKECYEFATLNKEEYGIWGGINFGLNEDQLW
jgi:hypothetical protein